VWERFAARLHYFSGGYDSAESFAGLREFIATLSAPGAARHCLFYLALPPSVVESVLQCMKDCQVVKGRQGRGQSRIMIEKPFGHDYASAVRLNQRLLEMFEESQIHRIDHYLAKDTIRNLVVFRFINAIFEPLWNREHVDNIQITAAEEIGVEGRGAYYEEAGVVRDMVQYHAMQVLALTTMEPPVAGDVESMRDKRMDVFKSLAPIEPGDFVFGQYRGYRQEANVDPQSGTPTFVALKVAINNWRWQGVPFYIRSGKRLPEKRTEVVVQFKRIPLCVLEEHICVQPTQPNTLIIRIQPDEGIRLFFATMLPGREDKIAMADMDFRYATLGKQPSEAYERVILDGLAGKPALFWRADGIEATWRAVERLLQSQNKTLAAQFPNYEPGTWGPREADDLIRRDRRTWFNA
jgi:glucose-6-phosphate 1-dehydrogenase